MTRKIQTRTSSQKMLRQVSAVQSDNSDVIAMAWCDKTSFNDIELMTGLAEKDVINLMQYNLKPSSFRMWRKRVASRTRKHSDLLRSEKRLGNKKLTMQNMHRIA